MAFTTDEMSQMKVHLGYTGLTILARPYFDFAVVFGDIVQNNTDSWTENYVRTTVLVNLNQLEQDMMDCRTNFAITEAVGDVKINDRQLEKIEDLYEVWVHKLEKAIGVKRAALYFAEGSKIEVC